MSASVIPFHLVYYFRSIIDIVINQIKLKKSWEVTMSLNFQIILVKDIFNDQTQLTSQIIHKTLRFCLY